MLIVDIIDIDLCKSENIKISRLRKGGYEWNTPSTDPVVAVDGIRIGSTEIDTDASEVRAVFMSPRHSALDILLTLTYKGTRAVLIVVEDVDPDIETIYRNEIRENLGTGIPTRVVRVNLPLDEFEKNEIHHIFDDVVAEILEKKIKPKKKATKKVTKKKKVTKSK